MRTSDLLTFAAIFALLPWEAHAKPINVTYDVICIDRLSAALIANAYENVGPMYVEDVQEHLVETGKCVHFGDFTGKLVAEGEIVHGHEGSFQLIGVEYKKAVVWTFRQLNHTPSLDI